MPLACWGLGGAIPPPCAMVARSQAAKEASPGELPALDRFRWAPA